MKNFASMLKQAQELQGRMAEMQAELENVTVEGSAGGGLVRISLSGKGDLKEVRIDPSMAKPEDVEILEDLLVAAHFDAKSKLAHEHEVAGRLDAAVKVWADLLALARGPDHRPVPAALADLVVPEQPPEQPRTRHGALSLDGAAG